MIVHDVSGHCGWRLDGWIGLENCHIGSQNDALRAQSVELPVKLVPLILDIFPFTINIRLKYNKNNHVQNEVYVTKESRNTFSTFELPYVNSTTNKVVLNSVYDPAYLCL